MAERNLKGDVKVEFTEATSRQGIDSGESVKTLFGKIRKWLSDLKAVAFSGNYNDLINKPTLGSAASKNVPSTGNANTSEVVMGNDSRLSDSRPASDVSAWAKATTKPAYTASEVGAATSAQGDKADSAVQTIKMNGNAVTKTSGVVDLGTVITAHQNISGKADKSATVSTVTYDTTNKKLTKTIDGTTSDVVTTSQLKTDMALSKSDVGLSNVGNFKAVSTVASQGLSDTEKANARANISAATSAQGTKADSAVQTIQINGTTQTKTNGTVNLPAYPTKSSLGLGNVNNTSDLDKPISTATQAALDAQQAQIDDNSEVSEVTDTTPYLYKSSEHDAVYDELVGGSVAWNQLVQNGNFESTSGWTGRYSTVSVSNNICTVTPSSAGTLRGLIGSETAETVSQNHKLLLSVYILSPITTDVGLSLNGNEQKIISVTANVWKKCECVWTNNADTPKRLYALIMGNLTTSQSIQYKNVFVIDLTQMFGTTIADYVYTLEQSTAGSGIAWLKSYGFFTKDYYAYNAGELTSVNTSGKKVVGKNLLEITTKSTTINGVTFTVDKAAGTVTVNGTSTNLIGFPLCNYGLTNILEEGISYTLTGCPSGGDYFNTYALYAAREGVGTVWRDVGNGETYTVTSGGVLSPLYLLIRSGVTVNNLVFKPMIRRADVTDPTFEPYTSITYPIQSTDLRGLYKLNGNKLYTDGDIYSADGTVTRKYGIVDLGTLNWQLTSGVFTPTTDIGAKVQSIQGTLANILCPKYVTIQQNQISGKDKVIFGLNWGTGVGIIDSTYSDANAFKTAMSGVYLIYELATPTTTTAPPFASPQMVYRNGTEEYLDTRDVPIPVGGNRKYVDIPDWMVNEYFDDVRAETSTLLVKIENINNGINEIESDMRGVTQDLNDLSGELDCLTIKAALVNNEVIIQNTSDFTRELYSKYFSYTKPKFAILKLQTSSDTYYYKALLNSSFDGQWNYMEASFITVANGEYIYNFTWVKAFTSVGTPTVTRKVLGGHNAGFHNSIFRGKYLGNSYTAAQKAAVKAGTFDDLFVGDYWVINNIRWRIAHFDYYLNTGDTATTKHHLVIVPDGILADSYMNATNVTTGAYVGSYMYTTTLLQDGTEASDSVFGKIKAAFGEENLLSIRQLFANAVDSNGNVSGWAWYNTRCFLMNQVMVYGHKAWANGNNDGFNVGIDKSQLALFAHNPTSINTRQTYWLRDVRNSANFTLVGNYGDAGNYGASRVDGVRPVFLLKGA